MKAKFLTILVSVGLLVSTNLYSANKPIYDVVFKELPNGISSLNLTFYKTLPSPQVVDKILLESLNHAVSVDDSRNIIAFGFVNDDNMTSNQYSGNLIYVAKDKKIMTMEEYMGIKKTTSDLGKYLLVISEDKTATGIKPEKKWYSLSLVFESEPSMTEAYSYLKAEIEKLKQKELDITAYVMIGDKNTKTTWKQMKDPSGGFIFMKYDSKTKILYEKNTPIK